MAWQFLNYKPLYLLLADHFEEKIRSGMLPTGSFLPPIREIIRLFEVSLPTVKHAVNILEKQGLIKVVHGSGSKVIYESGENHEEFKYTLSDIIKEIRDLFDIRLIMEPACLKEAFDQIDAEELQNAYNNMDLKVKKNIHFVDEKMHGEIVSKCRNPYMKKVVFETMKQIELYRLINLKNYKYDSKVLYEILGGIIEAINKKDRKTAVRKLKYHLRHTRDSLIIALQKKQLK